MYENMYENQIFTNIMYGLIIIILGLNSILNLQSINTIKYNIIIIMILGINIILNNLELFLNLNSLNMKYL